MPNPATPLPQKANVVAFSTRHLRRDLLDGLRIAVTLGAAQNIEDAVNRALEAGLPILRGEGEVRWLKEKPATTQRHGGRDSGSGRRTKKPHLLRHAK